jgi:hypothetical protein
MNGAEAAFAWSVSSALLCSLLRCRDEDFVRVARLPQKLDGYVVLCIRKGVAFALADVKGRPLKLWDARICINDLYRRLTAPALGYGVIGVED